jgi:hypothetical protein
MIKVVTPLIVTTLLVASAMLPFAAAAAAAGTHQSSRISFQQLLSSLDQPPATDHLHKRLYNSHGILRITVDNNSNSNNDGSTTQQQQQQYDLKTVRKRALSHLCSCPTFSDKDGGNNESLFQQVLQSYPKDVQQIQLPDGTVRRTLASATVGFDKKNHGDDETNEEAAKAEAAVLELPSWIKDKCGEEAYDSLEELRDIVASVTDAFVTRLDREQKKKNTKGLDEGWGSGSIKKKKKNDESYYRSVLSNANHLEHFHVYTKAGEKKIINTSNTPSAGRQVLEEVDHTTPTFDYHTDAGFFLSFVPAMDCHTYKTDDSSFYLKGETKPLTFQEDEVIILMGAGAQYWLSNDDEGEEEEEEEENNDTKQQQQYSFLAASHALRLKPNTHRSWYGKMHLLPSSMRAKMALTNLSTTNNAKYGDVLPDLRVENYKAHIPTSPVDGCGTTMFESSPFEEVVVSSPSSYTRTTNRRRRLQHVNSPANCNNVTNFFCWHQCINIPNSEYVTDYVRDGYSLYCLDPSIMASSDNSIPDATDPCRGGFAHNSNCVGSWQSTDKSVPGYVFPGLLTSPPSPAPTTTSAAEHPGGSKQEVEVNYPIPEDIGEQFCYGGTSMYMDGFHWLDSACVILLFPSWVLSTPFKFGVACFGSILFGIALEWVLYKRRTVYALPAGYRRLILSALVYGIQLTMGYFIMLLVMTYSGPLFLSCISGMVIGHVIFNAQDALIKKYYEGFVTEEKKNEAASRNSSELISYQNGDALTSYQNGHSETDDEMIENGGACCGLGAKSSSSKNETQSLTPTETTTLKESMVPSGATPCCQYTMENSARDTSFMD